MCDAPRLDVELAHEAVAVVRSSAASIPKICADFFGDLSLTPHPGGLFRGCSPGWGNGWGRASIGPSVIPRPRQVRYPTRQSRRSSTVMRSSNQRDRSRWAYCRFLVIRFGCVTTCFKQRGSMASAILDFRAISSTSRRQTDLVHCMNAMPSRSGDQRIRSRVILGVTKETQR